MTFELNEGQAGPAYSQYSFDSRGPGYNLFVSGTQSQIVLPGSNDQGPTPITLAFAGANPAAAVVPQQQVLWNSDYFLGNQSYTDLPNYAEVDVPSVYPGINLQYFGSPSGELEYNVVVNPGADLATVRMQYTGVTSVAIDAAGELVLTTPAGSALVQHAPALYQVAADGSRTPVTGNFVLNDDGTVGFAAGNYDTTRPLIVDPTMDYATYWGTSGTDTGTGVAVDANGNSFITGQIPALSGFATDVYVAKFNATGTSLLYVDYLGSAGGSGNSQANAIGVDPAGNAVLVGTTMASDYPTTSARCRPRRRSAAVSSPASTPRAMRCSIPRTSRARPPTPSPSIPWARLSSPATPRAA